MNQKSLTESDILDQIVSDFDFDNDEEQESPKTIMPSNHTSYRARRVQGEDHNSFSRWAKSKEEVRQELNSKLGTPKITLAGCIKLYTDHNIKIDNIVLWFPTKDVIIYKEYDRDMQDGFTGKLFQDEYDALLKDIKQNGIKSAGILDISNSGGAEYTVLLGEGNHRLKIAEELGHELFPLSFSYRYG